MPVANVDERMQSLLATLEECRTILFDHANPETAKLLSLAILELRMQLHEVSESELKALCDLMVSNRRLRQEAGSELARPLPSYLRLVK